MRASWACDDAGDSENAARVRNMAVGITDRMLMSGKMDWTDQRCLIRADMMRRASRFVLEQYDSEKYEDGLLKNIIDFEKELARRKDAGCYTVRDAEEFAEKQGGSAEPE